LIGFHDSLYSQPLEVDILARLRDIERFENVESLKAQLSRDVTATKEVFAKYTR
jgi:riboflavin kinase/FMN adenylyltransferase